MAVASPRFVDRREILEAVTTAAAADVLRDALAAGLDPELDVERVVMDAGTGQLLVMPSVGSRYATVKLVSVGGDPRIQGVCLVFDLATLAVVAMLDGAALTELRTPATSLLAARMLARRSDRVVVIGAGPQGRAHAAALRAEFAPESVEFVDPRAGGNATIAIARAGVICCVTTAREPLFDGSLVANDALVIAIGAHEPEARELDAQLIRRANVVVESRASAFREAGDLILARIQRDAVMTLAELVGVPSIVDDARPRVFKSTGMSWEDNLIAALITESTAAEQL
jgi:ornithine cyclodeaminase/alanine dehydrogenase-like protein (mu-crystallin family)